RFMLGCMLLDAGFFLLLKLFDNVYAWFPLRLGLGCIGASLFTASEAWIGAMAGDASRGRVLGLYAAMLSAGFGAGALLLPLTGTRGWTPFLVNAAISLLAMLPLLRIGDRAPRFGTAAGFGLIGFVRRAPLMAFSVALFGLYESIAMSLMPVWGVRVGLAPALAAATLSAIYFGSIAWQVPIGWLSDHVSRAAVLRLCAAVAVAGAVALPFLGSAPWPLMAMLFVWGGITTALYPVVLSMLGDRFSGTELVAGNAAVIMLYGIGSLVGPALAGAAMDIWNPHGLTVLIALAFAALLAAASRAKA
ncbi:MAG TPA: MFS transporter, partial [Candidatus Sulfotelmatobacter sp.]|nr:MFS transporter [Candidatus Sulfotelmatobacter sp.]